jgi:hypothetical protein
VPVDWGVKETSPDKNKHYVIIKVKDYLLADIEIEEIKLDGEPVVLPENFKGADGKYKPYNAFKKEFLKSRDDTTTPYRDMNGKLIPLKLQPGEFWVKLDLADKETISIKIKNPAAQFDADKFTTKKTLTITRLNVAHPIEPPYTMVCVPQWAPMSGLPYMPYYTYILDIPPLDPYPDQVAASFEVDYSLSPDIKFSIFTCINDEEFTDDDIIKSLIVERTETLNSIGGTEEEPVYGKSFSNIVSWDGRDDSNGYGYTSKITWRMIVTSSYQGLEGGIRAILVIETMGDDPKDDFLPLTVSRKGFLTLMK